MNRTVIAAAAMLGLGGCATPPPEGAGIVDVPAQSVPAPTPAPAAAPAVTPGLTIPSLTGNPATDIKNLLGWLGQQSVADLAAARDIAAAAMPPDLAGKLCHGWAAQTLQSLPTVAGGKPFSDIKGPISAFEKARVLLAGTIVSGTGVNGLLEQFNINCSPYIQSINYRAGKGALLIAGAATGASAGAPAIGAVQQLIDSAPRLFSP